MNTKRTCLFLTGTVFLTLALLIFAKVSPGQAQYLPEWSDPINISNSGSAYDPVLVIDAQEEFHIIWLDLYDGYKYTESADGLMWTLPKKVNFPFSPQKPAGSSFSLEALPQTNFIPDLKDSVHIFWRDNNSDLYYSKSLAATIDNPLLWNSPVKVSDGIIDFYAVIDSRGTLHLGYLRNISTESNAAGIYYRRLDGFGWSKPINLYASPYMRSLKAEDAHVRVAVSSKIESETVFMVWDDRAQKRIFQARSGDGGLNWEVPQPISSIETSLHKATPFNIEIGVDGDRALMIWQTGEPGSNCTQYSQSSQDGGDHWQEPVKILDEISACPESNELYMEGSYSILVSQGIQNNLTLHAWNGVKWSEPQVQNELFNFSNPGTYDPILFGCQQFSLVKDKIYFVGCEQGEAGDIWFTSHSFGPMEDWFSQTAAWDRPIPMTSSSESISSVSAVADGGAIHAFWVQSPLSDLDKSKTSIQYALWSDNQWSTSTAIITGLDGLPVHLSTAMDNQGRLLMAWVDQENGDMLFSWARSDRANIPSDWEPIKNLPSPSRVNSSPEILADASGRIVVAYAVPVNENRGIYVIQSADTGNGWSSPIQVFDGVSAGWEMINSPRIALSGDGRLHLLFGRYTLRNTEQAVGLFYSQSADGGTTWSTPELVSDASVGWSDVISFDQQTVHRIWQENNALEVLTLSQVSFDGGLTWGIPTRITSTEERIPEDSLALESFGQLHLVQLSNDDPLLIQDWKWNDSGWILEEAMGWSSNGKSIRSSIADGIISGDRLNAFVIAEYSNLNGEIVNEILSFARYLGLPEKDQTPFLASIATPETVARLTDEPATQPTPTPETYLPINGTEEPSIFNKNLMGLLFLIAVLIFLVVIFLPHKKRGKRVEK